MLHPSRHAGLFPEASRDAPRTVKAPPDGLLGLTQSYLNDPNEQKLNIGVGAFRTEDGKPYVLNVIRKAERMLLEDETRTKEYLPQAGDPEFCSLSQKLAFADCPRSTDGSIITLQSVSGSGAIRVLAELIKSCLPGREIYVSDPAWINYPVVFSASGLQMKLYRYWDPKTKGLDIEGLLEDLQNMAPGSIVVFQTCAHNPTGVDPTKEDWQKILKVVQSQELLPFFDSAYQGFATGDLDADAYALRLFEGSGMDLILAFSFSKSMGLYGERAGCLSVVCQNPQDATRVKTKLEVIIRELYATPPRHGAELAAMVLKTPDLFAEWKVELGQMVNRIRNMREELHKQLLARETPGDWSCLLKQTGMFAYSGLSLAQVEHLTKKWHIYLPKSGRFSMAGLSVNSCSYLADAVDDAVRNV